MPEGILVVDWWGFYEVFESRRKGVVLSACEFSRVFSKD